MGSSGQVSFYAHSERLGCPLQDQNGGWSRYVMVQDGPGPLEARRSAMDYQHYVAKQLQPIADSILQPLGESFAALVSPQGELF
ncbi:MAG: hypothetical protein LBE51_20140 [Acidovorax sp.]|jgi:DNA polymerase-2|nr:hypothetical protein [Acidovorax sp.]